MRPAGMRATARSTKPGMAFIPAIKGVSISPGAMAFTRTLCGAQSTANARDRWMTAALLTQ